MLVLRRGDRGKAVGIWQSALNKTGAGLRVDDEFGPLTEEATRVFQGAEKITVDGLVGDESRGAMDDWVSRRGAEAQGDEVAEQSAICRIAQTQLGIRETSKNQGTGIAKYWEATTYPEGYANREPYCAAFVCWCVMEVAGRLGLTERTRPRDAAVRYLVQWAQRAESRAMIWQGTRTAIPQAGDLVYFVFGAAGRPDHIGVVEDFDGTTVFTIEGNTDGTGGREGDGVYRRRRALSLCWGFIRVGGRTTA